VRRPTPWILAAALLGLAAITAIAAVPPNLARTIEEQRRLVTERPNDPAVYNDLGNLLLLVPQPAEAEEAYRKAVELDPDKVSALFNLGLLLQERGELREAYKHLRRVVKLEPRHAWAHYQLGALQEKWGQDSRAIDAYATAFSLDPQLAFPEVNPHIVDNRLVTPAMLKAYQSDYSTPVPQVYDEPGRIARLLVPPPQQQPAEEEAQAAAEPAPADPRTQAPGAAGQQRPTVLRPGNLDPSAATGQAAPQGRNPSGRGTPTQPGMRTWTRPEPQTIPDEETYAPPMEEGAQPGEVVTPPPGGVYYRPGIQSTGRLNIRVMPEREGEGRG
jgi:tetratricopeptide (TPR) repeat protein